MNRIKKTTAIIIAIVLTLGAALVLLIGGVFANTEYIYFDLAAGNVTIGKSTYSGYVYVKGKADPQPVTGEHKDSNKYYIYQSTEANRNTTGYKSAEEFSSDPTTNCTVPSYPRVTHDGKTWNEYITNNINVKDVSTNWDTAAANAQRVGTDHYITFASESNYTADVTIDNIWSTYYESSTRRKSGGIGAYLKGIDNDPTPGKVIDCENTHIKLRLKGDNRVCCVHYSAGHKEDAEKRNTIEFYDFYDGKSDNPGSITVADFKEDYRANHWNSAIGGADNPARYADQSDGIIINSGVIYAGTTPEDNCTAIGGGGNDYGGVTINGGKVTAVTAGTGTAIGGGIGYGDPGGDADVTITGGTIYAYNLGIQKTNGNDGIDNFDKFVPAAAIGGGGSREAAGGLTVNITITGGTIYAQSMGGPGIGGGGSAEAGGGPANITITGGTIISKSVRGKFGNAVIDPGVSIGGGTGNTGGGSVTLNINKESGNAPIVRAGSIGGGSATGKDDAGNPYKVGSAKVRIDGGDIIGQVIMAGENQNDPCSFTMTGGVIHSTNVIDGVIIGNQNVTGVTVTDPRADVPLAFKRRNGGAVFMEDPYGVAVITGGRIEKCTANDGGAVYMTGGTFILSGTGELGNNTAKENGGSVYIGGGNVQIGGAVNKNGVTVAEGSENVAKCAIYNCSAVNGGGVYVGNGTADSTVDIKGGSIRDNRATENGGGVYVGDGTITLSGDMKSKATPVVEDGKNYFTISTTSIKRNTANKDGGGMYVDKGDIIIKSGEINYNNSVNGAGMYVGNGTVTMLNGSIHDNTATGSGGGMYVSRTEIGDTTDNVTITGGSVKFNKADEDGGGMFVDQGNITINNKKIEGDPNPFLSTEISHNTATKDGGGVFVTGNVYLLNGSVTNNSAVNGGGFRVQDGTVLVYGGSIDHNSATENGGGMHVSATTNDALVDIFSGSISENKAKINGGGVSVVSEGNQAINVTVGVNCEHLNLDPKLNETDRPFDSFDYPIAPTECGEAHKDHTHSHIVEVGEHSSCPKVLSNTAENSGGGFYLKSSQSNLTFYCVTEQGNEASGNSRCDNMDVEGGHVVIGDKDYKHDDPNSKAKGNIIMQSSILVNGGTVDIYGTMVNPDFTDDVTVDIKNNNTDHYIDHRLTNSTEYYKVHYYENFKGDGDTPTGLYIARQYPDLNHDDLTDEKRFDFTIMSSIFSHPGWKIVGWNSQPDDKGQKYEVNQTYNFRTSSEVKEHLGDSKVDNIDDNSLLVIYAIWERCGYVLKFDPNVPEGETYTGTMENQTVTIGYKDDRIHPNKFVRPGYKFIGWALDPVPTDGKKYANEGVIDPDFTEEDGATVTLYAQWEKCDHTGFLVYTADGNVLTQSCSACHGHTATATLSAVDAVYDGKNHLATATFSANWIGDNKPEISYEMAEDPEWDSKDNFDDAWKADTNHQPVHAGSYTATITGVNQTDNTTSATAQVVYTISPIKWETPAVPVVTFSVKKIEGATSDKYNSIITITEPINDPLLRYKITLLPNGGTETDVDSYPDWQNSTEFSNIPYGRYYYFYAKVSADRDHQESDPSKSSAYLTTGGNIIYIKNGEGIKVVPEYGTGEFIYTVSAADGYHLRGYHDNLNLTGNSMTIGPTNKPDFVEPIPGVAEGDARIQDGGIIIERKGPTDGTYTYTVKLVNEKVTYHQITLEFNGAVKNATVAHKVTDGQVFSDFNDKDTTISCDSAFTAQFTVSDYIPDEYSKQALSFSHTLPVGTNIILKSGNEYWYYKVVAAATEINLTAFTSMGENNSFSFNTNEATATTFTYQIIVDFSETEAGSRIKNADDSASNLTVSLKLTPAEDKNAPKIPAAGETPHISVGLEAEAKFELAATTSNGNTTTLTATYKPSHGAASIWNGRETAIVLEATNDAPADLTLTAVVSGSTTVYSMNEEKQFIIPLDAIADREVKVTLNSSLFGSKTSTELKFNAKWYVSKSAADKSPINGYEAVSVENVTFYCTNPLPSIRIGGGGRHVSKRGELTVTINYSGIPSGATVTAYLQSKTDGKYIDTGAKTGVNVNESGFKDVTFKMGEMGEGSYRILVIVQQGGANILQVPYYFVIQEP